MCEYGNNIKMNVPIPVELSHSGELYWKMMDIDSCIAPIVAALNRAGIYTASSCCGHGKSLGHIWLQDGRALIILNDATKESIIEIIEKEGVK